MTASAMIADLQSQPAAVSLWQQQGDDATQRQNVPFIKWDRRPDPLFIDEVRQLPQRELRSFAADMRNESAVHNEKVHDLLCAFDGLGIYQQLAAQEIRQQLRHSRRLRDKARRFLNEAEIELSERREADRRANEAAAERKEERRLRRIEAESAISESKSLSDHDMICKYQGRAATTSFFRLAREYFGAEAVRALEIAAREESLSQTREWGQSMDLDGAVLDKYLARMEAENQRQKSRSA